MTSKPDSLDRNKTGVLTFLVRKIATLCFAALMFVVTPVFADAKKDAAKAQEGTCLCAWRPSLSLGSTTGAESTNKINIKYLIGWSISSVGHENSL